MSFFKSKGTKKEKEEKLTNKKREREKDQEEDKGNSLDCCRKSIRI